MMLPTVKVTALAAVVSIVLLVTGCAGADAGLPTLTETKGPTQLLRNEASSRIPTGAVDAVVGGDVSVACKSTEEDPKGLYRSWKSTVLTTIDKDGAWRVAQIGTDVSDSFIADGWYVSGTNDGKSTTTLTKPGAVSTLVFTTTEADDNDEGASIQIDATGPCVLTGGPESTEVAKLEAAK